MFYWVHVWGICWPIHSSYSFVEKKIVHYPSTMWPGVSGLIVPENRLWRIPAAYGTTIDDNPPNVRLYTKAGLVREKDVTPLSSSPYEILCIHILRAARGPPCAPWPAATETLNIGLRAYEPI
ncbi:hypothetical protein AVEN_2174-1 [Araneus ventricosus]|uniref:Uncharacterized protein n=1 Tax=Araneus ventricosus TaxID=182803 RepID=A0A4Y2IHV3_ARAVE|nr:hypothetical protein AVEN_2174-1 [Araneus ventricosus]